MVNTPQPFNITLNIEQFILLAQLIGAVLGDCEGDYENFLELSPSYEELQMHPYALAIRMSEVLLAVANQQGVKQ